MNKQEQKEFFDEFTKKMEQVIISKGDDYANDDRLSNFKNAGSIIGITAEKQCLSLIATKVARIGNLLDNKHPNNESIADSVMDMANYSVLMAMILRDAEKEKQCPFKIKNNTTITNRDLQR